MCAYCIFVLFVYSFVPSVLWYHGGSPTTVQA